MNPRLTLATGANSLLKEGGTALVIHADPDDERTDPAGNSGARIACGVITAAPASAGTPPRTGSGGYEHRHSGWLAILLTISLTLVAGTAVGRRRQSSHP